MLSLLPMLTRWGPIIAAVGAVIWVVSLRQANADLRDDLTATNRALSIERAATAQALEAVRVHRAYLDRMQEQQSDTARLLRDLDQLEGGDAPLSDYLRAAGQRLYPQ